jgi:hypothetical protein
MAVHFGFTQHMSDIIQWQVIDGDEVNSDGLIMERTRMKYSSFIVQNVDKLDENRVSLHFFACANLEVDWNVGNSLSAGGPPSAHLRLWGLPWIRYSRRSLAHPLQSTMFLPAVFCVLNL